MDNIPEILYKYSSLRGFGKNLLLDSELYAASASQLNDAMELSIPIKYTSESYTLDNFIKLYLFHLKNKGKLTRLNYNEMVYEATHRYNFSVFFPEEYWNNAKNTIYQIDNEFYGIISFTPKFDSNSMWGNYADNNKGICIGFDTKKLLMFLSEKFKNHGFRIGPVIYSDEIPLLTFNPEFDEKIRRLNSIKSTYTKEKSWEHESEYRFISFGMDEVDNRNRVIHYPKSIIKELLFGSAVSEDDKHTILKFVKDEHLLINIFEMEKTYNSFGLKRKIIYKGE